MALNTKRPLVPMNPLLTLHDPRTARAYYKAGLWRDETFYALLCKHAEARPDGFALRDSARRLTWAELRQWVDAVAGAMHEAGIGMGEQVSICTSNRVEAVITLLAGTRIGCAVNPSLHRNYTAAEIVALLRRLDATALIAEEGWTADAAQADLFALADALPSIKKVFRLPVERTAGAGFPASTASAGTATPIDENPDRVHYLAFTSGTTGTPKGVMHSANTLLSNARSMVDDWSLGAETVLLSLSPLSHHIAWVALAEVLVCGGELVVNDPAEGMTPLDWLLETGATYVMGVPTHAIDILAEQAERGLDRLGRVSTFYMAGAQIPPSTAQAFLDQGIKPQNVYGMSENSSHQYTWPDDDAETIVATCGRGGAHYEVKLFSQEDRDREVLMGEIGEIGGRGACLTLGYFDNQKATEDSFNRDGWFLSGDLGQMDEQGCLKIVGRSKDLIIRGGHNIHPSRIENLAVRHPGIDKAAAFAVADDRLGEKVCLAVIPASATPPTADAALDHLYREGLSKYDMPEYFICLDELPLTASGKILKRELVAKARDGRISPTPVRWTEKDPA